jgi:hypothetical protein
VDCCDHGNLTFNYEAMLIPSCITGTSSVAFHVLASVHRRNTYLFLVADEVFSYQSSFASVYHRWRIVSSRDWDDDVSHGRPSRPMDSEKLSLLEN